MLNNMRKKDNKNGKSNIKSNAHHYTWSVKIEFAITNVSGYKIKTKT